MLLTERYQPTRIMASASPFSIRRFGTPSYGVSMSPSPYSIGCPVRTAGAQRAMSDGQAPQWCHAVTRPDGSSPAFRQ